MMENNKAHIETLLAVALQVDKTRLFQENLTLSQAVEASPKLVNSVDFMESCAYVVSVLKKETGRKIQLPVTTLQTPVSDIVDDFLRQLAQ